MLGRIYYHVGYIDLAIGQFERVLKLDSGSYKALDNLGLCYVSKADDGKATRYFLTAIKLVEKNQAKYEWPYTNLADLLLKNGDAQRAYDAAAKAARLNPVRTAHFTSALKRWTSLARRSSP